MWQQKVAMFDGEAESCHLDLQVGSGGDGGGRGLSTRSHLLILPV